MSVNYRISPTTPLPPNNPITPPRSLNARSTSSPSNRFTSLIANACLIVITSKYRRPVWLVRPNSSASRSASLAMRCRALTTSRAGFGAGEAGKTVWFGPGVDGEEAGARLVLKVLEWESVGVGWTGPIERREAAK